MKHNEIIIIGAFSEIIELCEITGKRIVGIFDISLTGSYMGYEILGDDTTAKEQRNKYKEIPIIVTPDLPGNRKKIASYYKDNGYKFANIIHPNASISKYVILGQGVVIQNGVNISTNTYIGDFVKVNTRANVMHDCKIRCFTTIAPNAVILGNIEIGENCYIGANSTILPSLNIGKNVFIGAGSVVTKNVSNDIIVVGVPAKELK